MANVVKFNMKQVPAAISQMFVRVTDLDRNPLFEGEQPVTGASVEVDIGAAGTDGQGVLIHGDNYQAGNESTFKGYAGYGVVEGSATEKKYNKVVFIGASIMEAMFGDDLSEPNPVATQALIDKGVAGVDVYGAAHGGDSARDIAVRIPAILAAFPSNTLFVIAAGGNNVTNSRPYTEDNNGTLSNTNEWPKIISNFSERKNDVVYCSISFRSYGKTGELAADDYMEDEHGGSNLFNTDYLNSLILDQGGLSVLNGEILGDMYNQFRNNYQSWLGGDGVHETTAGIGATRDWLYDRIGFILDSSKGLPLPIIPMSYPSWEDPTNTNPERIDINFGGSSLVQNDVGVTGLAAGLPIQLLKPDGSDSGISIISADFSSSLVGESNKGVACNRPDATTLFSDQCTYKYLYFKSTGSFSITLSGLQPSTSYSLSYLNGKGDPMDAIGNGIILNLPESNVANISKTLVNSDDQGDILIEFSGKAYASYVCGLTIELDN